MSQSIIMVPIRGTKIDPIDIETKDHFQEIIATLGHTLEIMVENPDLGETVEIITEEILTDELLAILEIGTETMVLEIADDMIVSPVEIAHTSDPNRETDRIEAISRNKDSQHYNVAGQAYRRDSYRQNTNRRNDDSRRPSRSQHNLQQK